MKCKLILGMLTLLCALTVTALGQSKEPKLVIKQTEFNAGEIKQGTDVNHTFVVKNEGTAELQIKSVVPSCGCTASDFTKVIPPGEEGKITLTVHTAGFSGALNKYADVTTNDPQQPRFSLSMNMVISTDSAPAGRQVGQFIIGPSDRWSINVPYGASSETGIMIYNNGAQPARITKVIPGGEAFAVNLETLEEGKRYVLRVKSNPKLPVGDDHKQTVKLVVEGGDAAQASEIPIQLEAAIFPPVAANPKEINLGTVSLAADSASPIKFTWVRQYRGGAFALNKITSTLPFIKVSVEVEVADINYRLKIEVDKSKLKAGAHKGTIKVETNNPDMPFVEIGVSLIAK